MNVHTQNAILFPAFFALIGFFLWLLFRRFQSSAQLRLRRVETFNRMLERFTATDELVGFITSDTGRKIFDDGAIEPQLHSPHFGYIRGALLVAGVGAALLINAWRFASRLTPKSHFIDYRSLNEMQDWATIVIAVAVSLGLIALVSARMQRTKSS